MGKKKTTAKKKQQRKKNKQTKEKQKTNKQKQSKKQTNKQKQKTSLCRQIFHQVSPLCQVAVLPFMIFAGCAKVAPGKAQTGRVNLKFLPGSGGG